MFTAGTFPTRCGDGSDEHLAVATGSNLRADHESASPAHGFGVGPIELQPAEPAEHQREFHGPHERPVAVQSVTVNWGDGTVQTFNGAPGTYTHQYAVVDGTYTIRVSETDVSGTLTAPATTVVAALPTNQGTVGALYVDLLGRSVDPSGLSYWSSVLASGAPVTQVIRGIMASAEYKDRVINALYEKYLGRPADAAGLANFLPLLASSGSEAVAAAARSVRRSSSPAGRWHQRGLPPGGTYSDVLGRTIDPGANRPI